MVESPEADGTRNQQTFAFVDGKLLTSLKVEMICGSVRSLFVGPADGERPREERVGVGRWEPARLANNSH